MSTSRFLPAGGRRAVDQEMLGFCSRWLSRREQAFIRMVLDHGSTFEQIAHLTGESPSTVSRRFQRLLEKLINRRMMPALKAQANLDSRAIRVIQEYYIRGQTQEAIAGRFNLSLYRIRLILQAARASAAARPAANPATRPLSD